MKKTNKQTNKQTNEEKSNLIKHHKFLVILVYKQQNLFSNNKTKRNW